MTDEMLTRVQRLAPLAEAEGLTMAQMAVAWVLQNDNVASAITGGSRPEQVKANCRELLAGYFCVGPGVYASSSLAGQCFHHWSRLL